MTTGRLTRTCLAAPAHRPTMVAKAAASAADAVFMDLEDAVPPAEKAAALAGARAALQTLDWGDKRVSVRLNAAGGGAAGRSCAMSAVSALGPF